MTSVPPTESPDGPPRKRMNSADEANLGLSKPIANWQAKFAWNCAMWGLVPVIGLFLGTASVLFGLGGWLRVRRRPQDLGIRHAIGSIILGSLEIAFNLLGTVLVVIGWKATQ